MQPDESSGYRIEPEQSAGPEPYGENPPAYDASPAYRQPPAYAAPPAYEPAPAYGAAPGYGPPPYGAAPSYGTPPPYGPPQAGWYWPPAAPWNMPAPSTRWPYGPDRPGIATAAAVLGFVAAGLTLLMAIVWVVAFATGDGDLPTGLLFLGVPCAVGQILGGVRLLRRRTRTVLFASAIAAVGVLVVAFIAAAVSFSTSDFAGISVFLGMAAVLPIVTACLARGRTVRSWLAAAQPPMGAPHHF